MKLNPDCIRDILIYLEDNLVLNNDGTYDYIKLASLCDSDDLLEYDESEIYYSILKLTEAGYIKCQIKFEKDKIYSAGTYISDITWEGHEFLNSVRPETIWEATKNGMSKIGGTSISMLSFVAKEITKKVVSDPMLILKIVNSIL